MIIATNLTKIYGKTKAITSLNFRVAKGEIVGFLGPNGAGKTTTMRILTCHTPPTSGKASMAGFDVVRQSLKARRKTGYLPETIGLYEDMTVLSYLEFMAEIKNSDRTSRSKNVSKTMEQTGLSKVCHRLIRNLSKGFRQRVGLAQALVGNPEVLILDEPTVGLDPAQIKEIRTLISSMRGTKTIILSTHILPEVTAVCSRIAIINLGKIAAIGSPGDLAKQMAPDQRIVLKATGQKDAIISRVFRIPGVLHIQQQKPDQGETIPLYLIDIKKDIDVRKVISSTLFNAGCQLYELYPVSLSLEDVYMKTVMGEDFKNRD